MRKKNVIEVVMCTPDNVHWRRPTDIKLTFPYFSHTSIPPRWHIIVEDSANEHIYHSEVSLSQPLMA